MRVLHIEDDAAEARLLQETLKGVPLSARWEGARAETLEKGLAQVRRGGFDAVLLDLGLPDSQGLPTLRTVRQLDPDIPVVVLTGLEDEETALQALRDGAQDYLVKGRFTGPVLVRVLNNSIARAQIQIRLGDARRRVPKTPGAWSKVRLVHVHPAEHETAINRHVSSIGEAGGMVVLVCFDTAADAVRERLHRAGLKTSGILFVDATRKGPLAMAGEAALDDVALAIESSCDQLGIRSQVVLDCLNPVMERHGARETVRFMHVVGNRMRALGINLDFVVVDDANGRALSSACGGAVDTVTTARAPLRGVPAR
ncbi:MAG TPA: response regulator [Candidatus Thermoplasmatota archaeon]|nr:response regulator [Candidatus Thermoplasmatota archaeon]